MNAQTTFNWPLFLILVLITVPGILVSLPRLLDQLEKVMATKLDETQRRPSRTTILVAGSAQYLLLAALPAALGTWLAPRVGLDAPFFAAIAAGRLSGELFVSQAGPALLVGTAGAAVFVAAYYGFFRPRFDRQTLLASEGLRMEMGILSRILYGGIFEEVLARWGLMTSFAWLGMALSGSVTPAVMWAAIVLSGLLFGLSHLPNYVMTGSKATPLFISHMIVLNLWASLIFGWLFWQYGLLAAMLAHMLFHLVWWPFDRRYARLVMAVAR